MKFEGKFSGKELDTSDFQTLARYMFKHGPTEIGHIKTYIADLIKNLENGEERERWAYLVFSQLQNYLNDATAQTQQS